MTFHNRCASTRVSIWISVAPWRFTVPPRIYHPPAHTLDSILYFLCCPAYSKSFLIAAPCYNHRAGTCCQTVAWALPVGVSREKLRWSHQHLPSAARELWDQAGFHPVAVKLCVPSCTQWAAKTLPYGLDQRRCLLWFPACGKVLGMLG